MTSKRKIAAFDFDGTLTRKDSFIEFIVFVHGRKKLILGLIRYVHIIILTKLKLFPNWKAKQKVFSHFFKGMSYDTFRSLGEAFSAEIAKFTNNKTLSILRQYQNTGSTIYVITASIEEWVRPFCSSICVDNVIATQVEVDNNGKLTGLFASKNCYGEEKVNRLKKCEPDRDNYYLFTCGDSCGDINLLNYADESLYVGSDKLKEFIKFGIVGTLCTGIDAGIFYITNTIVNYQISLITGYLVSYIVNYFLTVKWTFNKRITPGNAIGVLISHLINLFAVRMLLMHLFVNYLFLNPNLAYIPMLIISIITNFIIIRYVMHHF